CFSDRTFCLLELGKIQHPVIYFADEASSRLIPSLSARASDPRIRDFRAADHIVGACKCSIRSGSSFRRGVLEALHGVLGAGWNLPIRQPLIERVEFSVRHSRSLKYG